MSLKRIVEHINTEIKRPFKELVTAFFGLSVLTVRSATETVPTVLVEDGQLKYVGMDDANAIRVYHRTNTIQVSEKVAGFGDERSLLTYTYNMSMYFFNDYQKTKLTPDEIVLLVQANLKDPKIENYLTTIVRITNIVLDTAQVVRAEYKNAVSLRPGQNLFVINYTIEATFSKTCLDKCT